MRNNSSTSTNSKDSRISSTSNLSATAHISTTRQCLSSSPNHKLNLNFNRTPNTFPTTTTRRK